MGSPRLGYFIRTLFLHLCLVIGLLTPLAGQTLPGAEIPPPAGPYLVGKLNVDLVDRARTNRPAVPAEAFRSLALTVWYPAEPGSAGASAAYLNPPAASYLISTRRDQAYRLPAELGLAWAGRVTVHALQAPGLAAAAEGWPVLLYAHGLNSLVGLGQGFLEDLASRGFVVVGIDNTNVAGAAVFVDGTVRYAAPVPTGRNWWDFYMSEYPDVVGDFGYVLGELARTKGGALGPGFAGRLRLDHVGVFGISFGGSAAIDFAASETRVAAAANLDGGHFGVLPAAGMHTPLLLLLSAGHFAGDLGLRDLWSRNTAPSWRVDVSGARHENFGDTPFLLKALAPTKAATYPETGTVEPARVFQILRLALSGFFAAHLGQATRAGTGWEIDLASFPEASVHRK